MQILPGVQLSDQMSDCLGAVLKRLTPWNVAERFRSPLSCRNRRTAAYAMHATNVTMIITAKI